MSEAWQTCHVSSQVGNVWRRGPSSMLSTARPIKRCEQWQYSPNTHDYITVLNFPRLSTPFPPSSSAGETKPDHY
eukprot:1610144-Amphidinium_carterae.1